MKRNKERLFFSCFLGIFVMACLWGNNDPDKWSNHKSLPKLTSIGEAGATTNFPGIVTITGPLTVGSDADDVSGQYNLVASDGDAADIAITTGDRLTFNDAAFYEFDNDILIAANKSLRLTAGGSADFHFGTSTAELRTGSLTTSYALIDVVPNTSGIDSHIRLGDTGTAGEYITVDSLGYITHGTTTNGDGNEVENWNDAIMWCDSTITGETTVASLLPAGYIIQNIIFKNTTANQITNLDIGFSDAGGEIVAAANLLASDEGSFTINQEVDDYDAADTIYLSSDAWNSANLIIWIRMVRMF